MSSLLLVVCLLAGPSDSAGTSALTIDFPVDDDCIIADPDVEVRGRWTDGAGRDLRMTVEAPGKPPVTSGPVTVQEDGTWRFSNVGLPRGLCRITVSSDMGSTSRVFNRIEDVKARPPQSVRFVWDGSCRTVLEEIFRRTLADPLDPSDVQVYVDEVEQRVPLYFARMFSAVADVRVVEGPPGEGVHTVRFASDNFGLFGESPQDYGNSRLEEESTIYLGSFLASFDPTSGRNWEPMRPRDRPPTRVDDIAYALARTCAHEVGHSVGLVGSALAVHRSDHWMMGSRENHNGHALLFPSITWFPRRFAQGRDIMDGEELLEAAGPALAEELGLRNSYRIGRVDRDVSTSAVPDRIIPNWNPFNRHYLGIVHPPPPGP